MTFFFLLCGFAFEFSLPPQDLYLFWNPFDVHCEITLKTNAHLPAFETMFSSMWLISNEPKMNESHKVITS